MCEVGTVSKISDCQPEGPGVPGISPPPRDLAPRNQIPRDLAPPRAQIPWDLALPCAPPFRDLAPPPPPNDSDNSLVFRPSYQESF